MKTEILYGILFTSALSLFSARAAGEEPDNLPDEYLKNLKDYEFVNTRGMKDLNPNRIPWIDKDRQDPDNWEFPTANEIQTLRDMGISFPDFEFIEGGKLNPGQKRQQTHVVEHIIYALPGDAVSLYPYYGLEEYKEPTGDNFLSTRDYLETFSHWYDYNTGGRVIHESNSNGKAYDLLDFPYDRGYIQISDYGFYGGIYMSPGTKDVPQPAPKYIVSSTNEYVDAVNAINADGGKGHIELTCDLDFSGINDVPMLGNDDNTPFTGIIDGRGYAIKNLDMSRNQHKVGLIRNGGNGVAIYNLVLDNCTLSGWTHVGLVAYLTGGGLTAKNIKINSNCTIKGTGSEGEHFVGAILGRCDNESSDNHLTVENVYVGGTVGNPDLGMRFNTALCGWLHTRMSATPSYFKNIVVDCSLTGHEPLKRETYVRHSLGNEPYEDATGGWIEQGKFDNSDVTWTLNFKNCYGNFNQIGDYTDPIWKPFATLPDMAGWFELIDTENPNLGGELLLTGFHRPWHGEGEDCEEQRRRKAGTSAVFYFPENLKGEWDETHEYVIAADFSQTFYPDENHIKVDERKVMEPLIAFRHIFRIRDARQQTEELQDANSDYARKNQHRVTAMAGTNFQIRLDSPLPTGWGTSGGVTNYYFKNNATGKYDRIRQFGIRVLNGDTREELPGEQGFVFGSDIRMRRSKPSAAGEYAEPENQFRYHSMLRKDNPGEGRYIVQVLAKDNNGNIITTSTGPMILMQYDIRFVGSSSASLLTDAELYDTDPSNKNNNRYRHARDEYLKEKYGDTQFKIDFDNYFEINKLTDETLKNKFISYSVPAFDIADQWYKDENKLNLVVWDHNSTNHLTSASKMQHAFYKWPIAWERSTYGFGYNYRYNYNMYMLATHSTNVPYHASADNWNANNEGDGIGLYDRLYYKTKRMREANPDKKIRQEQGYFYYVNAASDPGVSARINVDLPCAGSRVIVSAWVAEMTKGDANDDYEAANISFNFVAVMNETNERVVLHNFITGNIPGDKLGKWCNVYYSFIPRMSEYFNDTKTFKDVDHFELELAHNGESSVGADYAIDDIRAYVLPPAADASHDGFACDDVPLDLTIQASFETLLEKLGQAEGYGTADKKIDLYYAFVDKEKFEETGSMNDATIGKVKFSNNFTKNDSYTDNGGNRLGNIAKETAYRMTNESGDRMIVFETVADAGKLKIGKEYYVVFKSRLDDGDNSVGILPDSYDATTFFDLGEECSYNCVLTVTPALEVKIDGVIQPEFNELEACENQMPVIQLNVWSTDKEPVEVMKNAYFDWFDGSINDFENYRFKDYPESLEVADDYTEDDDAHYLQTALNLFRARYPEAESVAGIKAETEKGDDDMMLEQWMLDIIDVASSPAANGLPKLVLHQASFVVPPVSRNEGEAATKARFVAIPIIDLLWENAPGETAGGKSVQVCKSPTEIGISVGDHTPVILHGLSDPALNYPAELYDVPLRLGLNQIYKNSEVTSAASELRKIDIPLRAVSSSDGKPKEFSLVNEETIINNEKVKRTGCILLAQTNDPEYRNLGTLDDSKEETEHLLWVGEIVEFNAYSSGNGAATSGERKHFTADFDRNFKFKEGYFYRFRYQFEENNDEEIDADDETICNGHDIFTTKVVPQYLKWNGDKNLSWDNDDNWMRVTSSEILKPDASADDYRFTDGGNANGRGFAPLDFTRVVIDRPDVTRDAEGNFIGADGENPWLYAPATDNVEMTDEYNAAVKNKWTSNPDGAEKPAEKIGGPTSLIQYDMTARESQWDEERLLCRPWQANRCKEIHFLPGATIMNQQVLNYEKAWVDVELDHSRWYILSTPLQDAYAGDFYLPTEKARQETEMFREITFDTAKNDRFAPAVYQRGWDKSTANVYEFGTNDARNVAVKTFWSRVYNDATEDYGNGKAFSIKTDVSNANNAGDKVIFRLPKGDETYFYYKQDGTTDNKETAALNRENSHRLNVSNGTMTVTTANEGKYFLVGNPFMTYMDIKGFLSRNQDKLEQKYWVVTKDGQIAGSLSGENNFIASPYPESDSPEDATAIAPMQGFFVESKKAATSLDLEYDETMMRRDHKDGSILTQGTRSGDEPAYLRITSISEGRACSTAILVPGSDNVPEECVDAIDNRDLDILSTVFTAKGGHARSINFCTDSEGVEIGLIADEGTASILRFEGTEAFGDLYLYDASDDSMTPLEEVTEIEVTGAVGGRFYLTAGKSDSIVTETLKWSLAGNILNVTDCACTGELRVTVCDTLGRITHNAGGSDSLSLSLDEGVSIVKMRNANEERTVKLSI